MKGIKMSDCKFNINKEKRTIVCVISNVSEMLFEFIRENFEFPDINFYDGIDFWHKKFQNELRMPRLFMGKAMCAEEDEWNEELGKMIAFSRAKDKCYKSFFKRANLMVQTVDRRIGDMITAFNDFGLKLETKREALENQIESRTKKEGDA